MKQINQIEELKSYRLFLFNRATAFLLKNTTPDTIYSTAYTWKDAQAEKAYQKIINSIIEVDNQIHSSK